MRIRNYVIVALVLLAIFALSCKGGSGEIIEPAPEFEEPIPEVSLRLLDETYVDGGTVGRATLDVKQSDAGYTVDVTVSEALNLKALFFELDYDSEAWHPVSCDSTGTLDIVAPPIGISHFAEPGVVSHGQVVQRYEQHLGFNGDGVLARVEFAAGAATDERNTSTLGTPYSATPIVFADYYNKFLRVYYSIRGDYDNNGEVNIADIMPLSLFFNSRSSDDNTHGVNTDGTVNDTIRTKPSFYVDGNSDGEINLSDLSVIEDNYGQSTTGFAICATPDYLENYPFDGSMTSSTAVSDTFNLPSSTGYDRENRMFWEFPIPDMDYANHYWVHPVSGTDSGRASMVAVDLGDYPVSIDKEFDLSYDAGSSTLNWTANLRGDMDSNTEVNLADLTGVGINFGTVGPFSQESTLWVTDSTRDGNITFADIAIMENLFLNQENYRIYTTIDPQQVPQSPIDTQSIPFLSEHDNESLNLIRPDFSKRSRVSVGANLESGAYVWVRMTSDGGAEGPRSEVIQIP